jgi:hypothetical protein
VQKCFKEMNASDEMRKSRDRIPNKVINETFPRKPKRHGASEKVYSQLKKMILKSKFEREEGLSYKRIAQESKVSRDVPPWGNFSIKKSGEERFLNEK